MNGKIVAGVPGIRPSLLFTYSCSITVTSMTRWLNFVSIFGHLHQLILTQQHKNIAKVASKFYPKL